MIDESDGADNLDEVVTVDVIAMAPVVLECVLRESVAKMLWTI